MLCTLMETHKSLIIIYMWEVKLIIRMKFEGEFSGTSLYIESGPVIIKC